MQPDLPIHSLPRTMDFFPEGEEGVPWTVKQWPELHEAFSIESQELVDWHNSMANPESRPWNVVRRIFGVVPMFGEASEEEDNEDWDLKKLSKHWGVAEKLLRDDLNAITEYWAKLRVSQRIHHPGVNPLDGPPSKDPRLCLADEEIAKLLEEYRFDHLKGKDRVFVARRITELRRLFEDKHRREPAHQLVHMELNLQDNERTRSLLKARLDTLSNKADKSDLQDKDSAEIVKINDALEKNESAHSKLFTAYVTALDNLGSEEIEQGELRKTALGTASYFVESMRRYYENGDRSLIDGVFPADEFLWLTTPVTMRPAQYRPDLVVAINDAMKPYNLFDPDYHPPSFAGGKFKTHREAARRMQSLAKSLTEEEEPVSIPEIDDTSGGDDDDDGGESVLDSPADTTTPTPELPERSPESTASPQSEEDFMAM